MNLTITTPDHWQQLERWVTVPHFSASLLADGVSLTVSCEPTGKGMRYGLAVYINGKIQWKHMNNPDELASKFWRAKTIRLYSPAKKAAILKGLPKRQHAYMIKTLGLDASRVMYTPIHNTFVSLRTQLKKHTTTLQWLDAPEPQEPAHG